MAREARSSLFAEFRNELPGQNQAPSWAQGIFDAQRPGSFTHFYDTMSFGRLRVEGEVAPARYESNRTAGSYLSADPAELGRFDVFSLEVLRKADNDVA